MAFIQTTPGPQATGDTRAMYDRQQAFLGYLPNYATVFCHRPEIMTLWAELQRGIRHHISPRRYELVTLAAARALRSSYCSLAHARILGEYFSTDEIAAIAQDQPGPLTPAERAMMSYAAQVARDASAITQADVDGLKAHGFSDAEVFDIAVSAAARAFFSKVADGLGAAPDAAYREMPANLQALLTVGRPIDPPAGDAAP
jgi:uncharacterized peroxidase-related enzyme